MIVKNRVLTFLIKQYGNPNADNAIKLFAIKKTQYTKQGKL